MWTRFHTIGLSFWKLSRTGWSMSEPCHISWWQLMHVAVGGMLASVGLILGLVSLALGNRGGLRGENLALAGTGICAFTLSVVGALYFGLNTLLWDYFPF